MSVRAAQCNILLIVQPATQLPQPIQHRKGDGLGGHACQGGYGRPGMDWPRTLGTMDGGSSQQRKAQAV